MTKQEAERFVRKWDEDAEIDDDTLVELFVALCDRKPDQHDYDAGLWSLCCAMVSQTRPLP